MTQSDKLSGIGSQPGTDQYYAMLFSGDQREPLEALHAWYMELQRVVFEVTDPVVAQVKIKWWRDELQRIYDNRSRHPKSIVLQPWVWCYGLTREYFDMLIDGVERDIETPTLTSESDWQWYAQSHWGVLSQLMAQIAQSDHRRSHLLAAQVGKGLQLVEQLRFFHRDAACGRVFIPSELLSRHQLQFSTLLSQEVVAQRRELFKRMVDDAKSLLGVWREASPELRYELRYLFLLSELALRWLVLSEEEGYPFAEARVELTPLRKFFVTWRLHRFIKKRAKSA